jgi:ATP-dependent DNA helicase RecG
MLKGVGPFRAESFESLGVHTLRDLLEYFPRTYQSELSEGSIADLVAGPVQIARGTVIAADYVSHGRRPRFEVTVESDGHFLQCVWFYGRGITRQIHPGMMLRVQGKVQLFRNRPQMTNPKFAEIDAAAGRIDQSRYRPIYPATLRLNSGAIERIIEKNIDAAANLVEEWFDDKLLKDRGLLARREAYRLIHRPDDGRRAQQARRRLVYDEFMLMQLGLGISRRRREQGQSAPALKLDKKLDARIRSRFPFALTDAQNRAVWEIAADLCGGRPMNRLLQGDVGSGKTVVALYAMLTSVANKMQAALLAPTEVLAEQHYLTLSNILRDSSVKIGLYTSRTRARQTDRATGQMGLITGGVHIAVGTQALLQHDLEFAKLGLVVVDEQHRLGVKQRELLQTKGPSPHYLVMTATPIPRTLALSYFADVDVSTIDALPPNRQPIHTRWLRSHRSAEAYEFIREQVAAKGQAYVVVPRIDEDGLDSAKSVLKEHKRLAEGPLKGLRLGVLHGQLKPEKKQSIMAAFRDRMIDVLLATTVIEVGIDVPNATVMMIENAERFGLSQLHQLRGRVGRGDKPSHCLLIGDATTEAAEARLRTFTTLTDGFAIAEADLKLRGPGEFFGTRQHGLPDFKLADISSELGLLQQAKQDAEAILSSDPNLRKPIYRHLREALIESVGESIDLAQIG